MKTFRNSTLKENLYRISETKLDTMLNSSDMVLSISFDDIVTMLESNSEKPYTSKDVFAAYDEILKEGRVNARESLNLNMDKILNYLNK